MSPPLPDPDAPRRVLLITYVFPPVGGAGVQRVTKLVKYLPAHGWDVSVLTVANPSVPLHDPSLENNVPAGTLVRRARSWEPGYGLKATLSAGQPKSRESGRSLKKAVAGLARRVGTFLLQPDPQVLWLPGALSAGKRLLRQIRHDAILASGPPFSTFLLAAALGRSSHLPLVLDYRDEWTLSNAFWENKRRGWFSRSIQGQMQARVIRAAQGLVATTRFSATALESLRVASGSRARVTWIYNGYDPDDFAPRVAPVQATSRRFRIAYVGTLWNLTTAAPLVDAVRLLAGRSPELAANLELVFAGRRTGPQDEEIARLRGLPCHVVEQPYIEHSAAVELMRNSDVLCLLLSDLPGAGRVVPAKLFEYMASGRPIVTIAPQGETWDLLHDYPASARFVPGDIEGIYAWLTRSIQDHRTGGATPSVAWDASAFDRNHQARQMAAFLEQCRCVAGSARV